MTNKNVKMNKTFDSDYLFEYFIAFVQKLLHIFPADYYCMRKRLSILFIICEIELKRVNSWMVIFLKIYLFFLFCFLSPR